MCAKPDRFGHERPVHSSHEAPTTLLQAVQHVFLKSAGMALESSVTDRRII
jgi:hypothetical protein